MSIIKLKMTVVLIAFLQPFIILCVLGQIESISMTWGTVLQPLFIFTNAATSFYFFQTERWKIQALLLMLLTAFSVNLFESLHNIIALAFFTTCTFGMTRGAYHKIFIGLYLLVIPVYLLYNIFWAELVASTVLCAYHFWLLLIANKLIKV